VSFPFARYRDGQREALHAARAAFDAGHRVVALEAPTGAGKSAIAVALAREAGSAYLVTHQKLLQDQYLRDFPDLTSLKGRANYDCLVADTHAAAAPCLLGRTFPACDDCPYFTAKDAALAAHGTVMNYPYLLAEANHAGGFGPRELLVLDEAHGVEAALMRFVEVRLSDGELARAGIEARLPQGDDAWGLMEGALDLVPALRARLRDLAATLETLPPTSGRAVEALRRRRWLDAALRGLDLLAESSDAGEVDWVVDAGRDADGRTLAFRPVDVAALAEPLLFRLGRRVLLMSATLLDAPTFLRSLGLDPDGVAVVRAASTFPPERRPVRLRPAARLTRHRLAAELPRLVDAVAELMREHPTEKGVVHAHSYRIATAIEEGLPPDLRARLRSHRDAGGRDAALAAHLDDAGPSVLLTPSMTEGIDLAGDAARWQAICKIPWPYLGDPQVAARRDRDPGWYAWRACLTVVQAYGRSVRSADDRAVTYLLDADFPAFLRRERARLPAWFVEAIDEAPPEPAELG
jgi:Rad3-related DNA helicase